MRFKRILFLCVGGLSFVFGGIGIILPLVPSVPFFLLAGVCFAKGSSTFHRIFLESKIYKRHVEHYVQRKGMTLPAKALVILCLTVVMGICMLFMNDVPVGRVAIGVVWLGHLVYFSIGIKTAQNKHPDKIERRKAAQNHQEDNFEIEKSNTQGIHL